MAGDVEQPGVHGCERLGRRRKPGEAAATARRCGAGLPQSGAMNPLILNHGPAGGQTPPLGMRKFAARVNRQRQADTAVRPRAGIVLIQEAADTFAGGLERRGAGCRKALSCSHIAYSVSTCGWQSRGRASRG